jgi:hypothetical protein
VPAVDVRDTGATTDTLDATSDAGSRCLDTVGLQPLARLTAPNGGTTQNAGHLNEILPVGDLLYAANAEDTVATFGLSVDGSVRSIAALPTGVDGRTGRVCTTVALHPTSRTIYCGFTEDASRGLTTFRLGDDGVPALRDTNAIESLVLNVRHLHVVGDTLYFALFRGGLWAASIASDGALSNFHDTGLAGDIRFVEGDASRLVVLDNDRGLVIARPEGERVVELGRLGLDGPKIGLSLRGDRALVALGSAGAYAVNVAGERPVVEAVYRPPGVVTSVDRDGDALAVACTSGVFLYDVAGVSPRLAGFANARAIMLHARFHRGELLVADWLDLVRYRVNLQGRPRPRRVVGDVRTRRGPREARGAQRLGRAPDLRRAQQLLFAHGRGRDDGRGPARAQPLSRRRRRDLVAQSGGADARRRRVRDIAVQLARAAAQGGARAAHPTRDRGSHADVSRGVAGGRVVRRSARGGGHARGVL